MLFYKLIVCAYTNTLTYNIIFYIAKLVKADIVKAEEAVKKAKEEEIIAKRKAKQKEAAKKKAAQLAAKEEAASKKATEKGGMFIYFF